MHTLDDLSPEERLLMANRLLRVLEQLFSRAAIDPDGQPFAGPAIPDFFLGVVVIVQLVLDLIGEPPPTSP